MLAAASQSGPDIRQEIMRLTEWHFESKQFFAYYHFRQAHKYGRLQTALQSSNGLL